MVAHGKGLKRGLITSSLCQLATLMRRVPVGSDAPHMRQQLRGGLARISDTEAYREQGLKSSSEGGEDDVSNRP